MFFAYIAEMSHFSRACTDGRRLTLKVHVYVILLKSRCLSLAFSVPMQSYSHRTDNLPLIHSHYTGFFGSDPVVFCFKPCCQK